jgi:general secretion pathway protein C
MIPRDDSPMGTRTRLLLELRQRVPQGAALLIAALGALDATHSGWALWSCAQQPEPHVARSPEAPPLHSGVDVQQVVNAHLFGRSLFARSPGGDPNSATDSRFALALSGIVAGKDPEAGYAILGEPGKPARLYATGSVVAGTPSRLFQVFFDRVVLETQGELEVLRLPRNTLVGLKIVPNQPAAAGDGVVVAEAGAPAEVAEPAPAVSDPNHPTPAEGLFNYMGAEQNNVDGRLAGLIVHPPRNIQRQYGLHDGDMLTAINGVTISNPDILADLLRTAGHSLSLTLTRDGVQQTTTVQLND